MTAIVKTHKPSEFLVALPHMLGYRPSDSILLQTFQRRRTAASLRVDLPSPEDDDAVAAIPDALIRLISRVPAIDGILVIIYSREPQTALGVPARAELVERIVTRMASAGLAILDALWTDDDEWISYLDGETGTIAELENGPLLAEITRADPLAAAADIPAGPGAPELEPCTDEHLAAVKSAARALSSDRAEREHLWEIGAVLPLWKDACDSIPAEIPAEATAALLWSLRDKDVRDCVLIFLAWGEKASKRAARDTATLRRGGQVPNNSILMGFAGEARRAPDGLRLECAIALLRHLAAVAPEPWRLAPLTLLGWLEWARGHGSAAGDYLDAALEIGPGYELARLFKQMMRGAFVPDWVGRAPL